MILGSFAPSFLLAVFYAQNNIQCVQFNIKRLIWATGPSAAARKDLGSCRYHFGKKYLIFQMFFLGIKLYLKSGTRCIYLKSGTRCIYLKSGTRCIYLKSGTRCIYLKSGIRCICGTYLMPRRVRQLKVSKRIRGPIEMNIHLGRVIPNLHHSELYFTIILQQ